MARDVNHDVKTRLGFADAQRFSQSLLDEVGKVASTSLGDDCGEGFLEPTRGRRDFAAPIAGTPPPPPPPGPPAAPALRAGVMRPRP